MLPFDRAARRRYGLGGMRLRNRILRFVQAHALRRADLVIFISEHGRRTIDRALGRRRGASALIHHGAARDGEPLDPPVARRLPRRFVLYLSTVHPYKAQLELIHAWSLLRARGPLREKLVLAGAFHAPYVRRLRETIARHGLEQEVVLLGPVAPDQIFDLAGRAVLNLFLSTCENCPITLLELMSVGRPLLVSSRPPMPELGGPDLSYVDPCDISAVANAIASLLADDEARRRLGEAAARRAPMFSWARCGAATWAAIQAVADEAAPSSSSASDSPATARR
jgi:glycosyltransferase involved in cell wall biosynthesis